MDDLNFQSFPNNFSENSTNNQSGFTGGNLGDRDRNTLVDDNVSVGSSGKRFFSVSYFQQYFDVDTDQVVKRILNSVVPTNNNFILDFVQPLPDLWGPFWISVTLVFSIGIFGNIAQYIENDGVGNYGSDFRLVTTASTLIFLYVVFVPMILFGILWHRKSDLQYPYFDIVCAYGYSLTIFIPVSLLWMLNVNWFRWALIFVSVTLSGGVLAKAIYPAFKNDSNRLVALGSVLMVFLLHFLLAFAFKEMFFDAVHPLKPEPQIGGASQTLGNHTMLAANGTSPILPTILSTTALPMTNDTKKQPNETPSVPSITTAAIAKNTTITTTTIVPSTKAAPVPNATSISNTTLTTKTNETATTVIAANGANTTTKTP